MERIVGEKETSAVVCRLLEDFPQVECSVGFDGYIDELYHVVKTRKNRDEMEFYTSIESFGKRVLQASHKSADLELVLSQKKLGGNGPILSNALAKLGIPVVCVGSLDVEGKENPFSTMPENCHCLSFGSASRTIALEFDDGKIMLGNLLGNYCTWEQIKKRIGLKNLCDAYRKSGLIAIVNWSGLQNIRYILEGYQQEVCSVLSPKEQKEKIFFFDLADPTVLCEESLDQFLSCVRSYSKKVRVILGLNENEALQIGRHCSKVPIEDIQQIGKFLQEALQLFQVIIHTNSQSFSFSGEGISRFQGMYVEHPIVSTGAGDHFNAGYLWGVLAGLPINQCLLLGQGVASYYLRTAQAPTRKQLADFLVDCITPKQEV